MISLADQRSGPGRYDGVFLSILRNRGGRQFTELTASTRIKANEHCLEDPEHDSTPRRRLRVFVASAKLFGKEIV